MDRNTGSGGIGLAVRRARHAKGLTLAQAAGQVGKTGAWLSKIENGHLPLEKRSDIAALAQALEVSADALIGEPAPEIRPGRQEFSVQPLRGVLLDACPGDPPDIPARPLAVLRDLNTDMDTALRKANYAVLHQHMPCLLGELLVHTAAPDGAEREEALRQLVLSFGLASVMLKHLGRTDLGWIAAERGRQAAVLLGDPVWSGAAAFELAHAINSANRPRALLITPKVADELEPHCGDDVFAREVYGMLCLSAALACAVGGDHAGAEAHGGEAARVAGQLGDRAAAWEVFGPSNVGVWRTSLAVEAGNAEQALTIADAVEPRALASSNRRAALRMKKARARAMRGEYGKAVAELRQAERLSPAHVHSTPLVRELVTHMLNQARREAGGRELRGLAWRMGVI